MRTHDGAELRTLVEEREPAPGSSLDVVLRFPEDWSITGQVVDGTGALAALANVFLWRPDRNGTADDPADDPAMEFDQIIADADGRFDVQLASPGTYHLMATWNENGAASAVEALEVPDRPARLESTLVLLPPGRMAGRVVDAKGEAVPGAIVFGRPAADAADAVATRLAAPTISAPADARGSFVLAPATHGVAYRVLAAVPGEMALLADAVHAVAGMEDITVVVRSVGGEQVVRGRVVAADSLEPVPGVALRLVRRYPASGANDPDDADGPRSGHAGAAARPAEQDVAAMVEIVTHLQKRTDSQGRFVLEEIPGDGPLALECVAAGYARTRSGWFTPTTAGPEILIELLPLGAMEVIIRAEGPAGSLRALALERLDDRNLVVERRKVYVAVNEFVLLDDLEPGTYRVACADLLGGEAGPAIELVVSAGGVARGDLVAPGS